MMKIVGVREEAAVVDLVGEGIVAVVEEGGDLGVEEEEVDLVVDGDFTCDFTGFYIALAFGRWYIKCHEYAVE